MLKALLFADRNALDEKIKNDYAKARVIHLLSLSGLHIGLIVGFLLIILKPLEKLNYGYLLRSISVILFLWLFPFFYRFPSLCNTCCMHVQFYCHRSCFTLRKINFSLYTTLFFCFVTLPSALPKIDWISTELFGGIWNTFDSSSTSKIVESTKYVPKKVFGVDYCLIGGPNGGKSSQYSLFSSIPQSFSS